MPGALRWLAKLGPLNPVAVRLVQNGSGRKRHMYVRSGYLGVLILALLWLLILGTSAGALGYRELATAGARGFILTAYLQLALICVVTPIFMAGAISQEADPRTWDIMLTTPLGGAQIVLGQLLGRLFFIIALLASSLPLMAATRYFGGAPGGSILSSYLIAGSTAVLVGCIAVALSVSRAVGKRAVFAFYVAVVSYIALTWGVDMALRAQSAEPGVTMMTPLNPFLAMESLLSPASYPRAGDGAPWAMRNPVLAWCCGSVGVGLVLVTLSTMGVRTGGLAQLGSAGGGAPWYRRLFGLRAATAQNRAPRPVWENPIAWREATARNATLARVLSRWIFVLAGVVWGVGLVWAYHTQRLTPETYRIALVATVWAQSAVIVLVAINMSATSVTREREDGTLDLLLTTTITPREYLWGKLRGLAMYLFPLASAPLVTICLAGLHAGLGGLGKGALATMSGSVGAQRVEAPTVLPEALIVAPLTLLPFVALCVVIGLHWSLRSRGVLGSTVSALAGAGAVGVTLGICGLTAGPEIPYLGPIIAGLTPTSAMRALIYPVETMSETIAEGSLSAARGMLLAGSAIGAALTGVVVYGLIAAMTRGFDTTTRKLAGSR